MTKDIQTIKERVRALLMKAADAAATPSEAEVAMHMAKKLMEKYQVTEADLGSLTGDDFKELDRVAERHKKKGAYLHPVERYCAVVIGKYCGIVPYMHYGEDGELAAVRLFGLESDVELASWMLTAFRQQFENDWEIYKRFQMQSKRLLDLKEARLSFSAGFTQAINKRLNDWMFRDAPKADKSPVEGSDGTSLVVKKLSLVQAEMERRGLRLGAARRSGGRVGVDTAAAGAGFNSGSAANVGRATAGQSSTIMIGN